MDLTHHSCLVYKIKRYDTQTHEIDENYAFAVQPLLRMHEG